MAYETRLFPIEYLIRRSNYYNKQINKYARLLADEQALSNFCSGRFSYDDISRALLNSKRMKDKFDEAVLILSQNT